MSSYALKRLRLLAQSETVGADLKWLLDDYDRLRIELTKISVFRGPDPSADCPCCHSSSKARAALMLSNDLCPHGMPLADNTCGPCSKGKPNSKRTGEQR